MGARTLSAGRRFARRLVFEKGMSVSPNDYAPLAVDRGAHQGLPNNTEAEANVLSAMLLSPDVVDDAISELRIDDFYRPAHRELFVAMVSMNERAIPIDSISVVDFLASEDKLSAVGGEAYILELVGNTISLANWQHHAEIVRRDSLLRELIKASSSSWAPVPPLVRRPSPSTLRLMRPPTAAPWASSRSR